MITKIISFFFFLFSISIFASNPAKDQIEEINRILVNPINKNLSDFFCIEDNWKKFCQYPNLLSFYANLFSRTFQGAKDKYENEPNSRFSTEYIRLLDVFSNSPSQEIGLRNLINILNHIKLAQAAKNTITATTPPKEKEFIENMTPHSFVMGIYLSFAISFYVDGIENEFTDRTLLNELKRRIPNPDAPPNETPSNSTGQTPPSTRWSTTKKVLIYGGFGLVSLVICGLKLYFALRKPGGGVIVWSS